MLPFVDIQCPYCGETIAMAVDDSGGDQSYIEDCQVCCRPIEIALAFEHERTPSISARAEDDA